MTVSSQTSRIEQLGDGTTTAFAVSFYFLADADLKVFVDGVQQTIVTNYTVTGAGNPAGGSVNFVSAPANGVQVVIFRDPALTQGLDYIDNDPFPAESHERGLDKLTMIAQRIRDLVSRALRLGDSVVGVNTELPALTGGQLLGTNPGGTGFQLYPLGSEPDTAANIVYTPSGTGAVATTVETKLRESVSVLDFGAVADGNASTAEGTDNSAAFQLAFDYAQTNSLAVYVPAGVYVLRSQVSIFSNVRVFGAGMYRTFLIAPQTFTGNGLLILNGAGGPPTVVEHMCILGATATGAGSGSTGISALSNANILQHLWVGGFTTLFAIGGTDVHCFDCWADVTLASGTGFSISNGSNSLVDCVTFNCYTGILINGGWEVAEPDIEIQITNCNIIQSGYSGISIVNANNINIANVSFHSPTTASKFDRDFITVTNGRNITINGVHGNFGNAVSTTCTGINQTGETNGLNVSNSNIRGCNFGMVLENAPLARINGNNFSNCTTWGMKMSGGSVGAVVSNNSSWFNGTDSAINGGGFWIITGAQSGRINVSNNSAGDFGGVSKYGFYFDCNAASFINAVGNSVTNTASQYFYAGAVDNVLNKSTSLPALNSIVDEHYEEGDWTPQIFYGATESTYTSRGGKFTRIGRLVICQMQGLVTRNAGTLSIRNLPFVAANFAGQPDILFGLSGRDFSTSTDFTGWVEKGTMNSLSTYTFPGAGDSEIRASIMYIV